MRRLAGSTLHAVVLVLLCGSAVRAHEIGTTRVSVVFAEGRTYDVEIVTDAAALVGKLVPAGSTAELDPPRLQYLLTSVDEQFRQRVQIAFDAADVRPAISYSVAPGTDMAAPVATLRLSGRMPADARHFTWAYGWTFASYAMTVQHAGSENRATEWLDGGQRSAPIAVTSLSPPADRPGTAWRYLTLGFTHILPDGLDHMLFVLGLYLLTGRGRSVLWQVSAFTVAHSITLALGMYGVLAVPPGIVEPLIALSIAYVAIENLFRSDLKSWRIALVFAFGLLHGMGFAGALSELGLPRGEFVTALVAFNIGVEAGQLAVIGAAFALVGWQYLHRAWYRRRIVVPASALIACAAVYWTIDRLPF